MSSLKSYFRGFYVSFLNYGPKVVKNCAFFAVFWWCQQKTVIAIHLYVSQISRSAYLESDIGYYAMN